MYQQKRNGEILRELRGTRPRCYVAKQVGISESALAMYESGDRNPRDEVKLALAKFYNKSVSEIFFTA